MLPHGLLRHRHRHLACPLAGAWALAAADSNVLLLYSNSGFSRGGTGGDGVRGGGRRR